MGADETTENKQANAAEEALERLGKTERLEGTGRVQSGLDQTGPDWT